MDEPTAAISVRQVAEVLNLIRQLRDRGIAIVFISHRMPDVFSIADRLVVLRRGRKVADKDVAASSPEEVTGLITGAIEHVFVNASGRLLETESSLMEIQFDDGIKRARFPLLSWLTSRQAFWVLVAVGLACIFLSFATNSFATSNNIFNVARNFTVRRDHRAGDDDCDHHRRHRSVGRLGAVPVQHDSRGRDACRLQHRGRHRRRAWNGVADPARSTAC